MWFNLKLVVSRLEKLKTLGFYQDKIKRLDAFLDKMLVERKLMSVEGGPGGGPAISAGAEAGSLTGAAPVSGLARMDSGPAFGAASAVVNEGPVGLAALKLTVPLEVRQFDPVGEIKFNLVPELNVTEVIREAEVVISQVQKPPIPVIPANTGIQLSTSSSELDPRLRGDDKKVEPESILQAEPLIFPEAWPRIEPVGIPNNLEFLQPQVVASPAVEPLVQPGLQIENQVFNEAKPIVLTQPALEEQETQQEMVMKRVTVKKIDTD